MEHIDSACDRTATPDVDRSRDVCLADLSPEVVRAILLLFKDADFGACMRASCLFHVHTWADYIERRYGRMTQPLLVESAPLEAIEYLHTRGRFHPTVEDTAHAARNRRADLFAWLDAHQRYRACTCPIRRGLAQGGDVEFARRFFDDVSRSTLLYSMEAAASKGQVDVLSWLSERASPTPDELVRVASAALGEGHIDAASWALDRGASGWGNLESLCRAMQKIDPAVVARWVTEKGYERHVTMRDLFNPSGCTRHASLMDWKASIAHRRDWNDPTDRHAVGDFAGEVASCGRLDILRDMEARKPGSIYYFSRILSHAAAKNGHMDVIESVLGGDPQTVALEDAMDGAILGGQWHILDALATRYAAMLAEPARVWESVICRTAYTGVEALERASAICGGAATAMFADASWISRAIARVAYGNGSLDAMKHLCDRHGTTAGIPSDSRSVDIAAGRGDLDMLRWLHECLGWDGSDNTLFRAVYDGRPDVVRYLCAQGMGSLNRLDDTALKYAAYKGDVDTFKALRDHGLDESSLIRCDVVERAVGQCRADFVAWLCDTYPQVCKSTLARARVPKCPHGCGSPLLVFADVDIDWMRVMDQYGVRERTPI